MNDFDGPATPLPRRRGCRFSCRTLLLVVAAVAVCLGIGVRPWQRHRVLQIIRRELNGGVVYSYRYRPTEHGWSTSAEAGPGPTWLRQSLSEPLFDDLFCDVAGVIVGDFSVHVSSPTLPKDVRSPVDDTHLKRLRKVLPMFNNLKFLCVMTSTKATDEGLAHLADVPQLEQLDLDESRVTGAGLRHLARAGGLKYLSLRSTSNGTGRAYYIDPWVSEFIPDAAGRLVLCAVCLSLGTPSIQRVPKRHDPAKQTNPTGRRSTASSAMPTRLEMAT